MKTDCLDKIPITLKEPIESGDRWIYTINIPCGKCARCIQRRKMEWAFRMEQEMTISKTAYFVTLTYNNECIPYNQYGKKTLVATRDEDLEIKKAIEGRKRITKAWKRKQLDRSLQGYFKRLRRLQDRSDLTIESIYNGLDNRKDKLKFYAAGEYGSLRGRPHYHAIIFNASERNIIEAWNNQGNVHCVKANKHTIGYVMKYLDKQIGEKPRWDVKPEFNIMSEGIGLCYVDRNRDWHRDNIDVLYVTNNNGIRIPMPKYYRLKIFTEQERKEQVEIVTNTLEQIKWDTIAEFGIEEFNHYNNTQPKEDYRRFVKANKKRIVD